MIRRYLFVSVPVYIALVSFFITTIYSIPGIFLKVVINYENGIPYFVSLIKMIAELFLEILISSIFLYIFSFSRLLLKIVVILLILVSSIFSYYVLVNNVFIDEFFVATIFETPLKDAGKAIDYKIFIYIFILGIIPAYFWIFIVKIKYFGDSLTCKLFFYFKSLIIILGIWLILILFSYYINKDMFKGGERTLKNSLSIYMPLNFLAGFYQYFLQVRNYISYNTYNIADLYPFYFYDQNMQDADYTIILVIGESARAKNQSLNGYERNTNPNLVKEKNLINFSNVFSCATYTVYSVNCMLSYKDQKNFQLNTKESNLISAFKKLGFETYYFSTQPLYNETSLTYFIAKDADVKMFSNQIRAKVPSNSFLYDEYLLDFVKEVKEKSHNKKKLIILHLMSNHTPYEVRYPKKFAIFKGENIRVDYYDNSVLYTDFILSKLINMYRNENAFLYFSSDHGESLGEDGKYLHAAQYDIAPVEQKHIFQFIWVSEEMKRLLGDKFINIKNKKDNPLSHDNLFHTMFDCLGVKSSIVNTKLSLCSKE